MPHLHVPIYALNLEKYKKQIASVLGVRISSIR